MKKIKLFMLALLLFAFAIPMVNAEEETNGKSEVNVYIFKKEGCRYCAAALSFFESIEAEYGAYFNLVKYDVSDTKNAELMEEAAAYFNYAVEGVPFIVIGNKYYPGFSDSMGEGIKTQIMAEYNLSETERTDVIKELEAGNTPENARNKKILIISVVSLVAVIGFVTLARHGVDEDIVETKTNLPEKKSVVEEIVEESEEDIVVEKKTTKKRESAKKDVKDSTKKKTTTTKKKSTTNSKNTKNKKN